VHVVAFLPKHLLSHLRIVLGGKHALHAADAWAFVDEMVRREPIEVAIVDPVGMARSHTDEIIALVQRFPSLPVMLYTSLAPSAMIAVAELAPHGVTRLVLHRYDDEPKRFLEKIEGLPVHALGEKLLGRLDQPLALLPPTIARAVERLMRLPHLVLNVEALAAAAGVTVRTVYRHIESAGLASPRTLIVGARLLRGYSYLKDPGLSVEEIAGKLGYSEPRIFTRNSREAFGMTPTTLRHAFDPDAFIDALLRFIHPDASRPPG
jgi:AraC-like DNA-binding protein